MLRKPIEASRKRASPADAFYPEAPCPRATTQASRKCQTLIVPRQSRGFTLRKLSNQLLGKSVLETEAKKEECGKKKWMF
jgi:hypothetical protein